MNPRRSPRRVFRNHAEDQFARFFANALPACASLIPRAPCPIQFETNPMPSDDSLRLDNDKRALPPRPEPPQHHPKNSVPISEPWPGESCLEDIDLLSPRLNFQ